MADGRNGKRADPFYRSAVWRALRERVLERDGRSCTDCGNPATHVDHVVPRSRGGPDRPDNLRSLCGPCHSAKTCRADGGFGNAPSRRQRIGPDGWPVPD